MNKKDRNALCYLIAQWEWMQGGGGPEAGARAACGKELIMMFSPPEEDLLFARLWEIAGHMGIKDDDVLFDALTDMANDVGYEALVDKIEAEGFAGVRLALEMLEPAT